MMRRFITPMLLCVCLLPCSRSFAAVDAKTPPPNIVLFLADDLGIECLSTYGGVSHDTPNLDRLAKQGTTFKHCFSAPYSSPSRAMLLTEQYPSRNGIREVIYDLNRHADLYLYPDRPSLARQPKQAGYATAIAGKWQLSFLHRRNTIKNFGFEHYPCWQIFDERDARRALQAVFEQLGSDD